MMSPKKVSGWEKASTVATFLQLLVVGISLLFIGYQLRQQKLQLDQQVKLSRAANTQSLVDLVTPLNLKVTERGMADVWVKGEDGINKVSNPVEREIEKQEYASMIGSYLDFYENAYWQYRNGLLDENIYNGWDKDLADFIEERKMAKHWDEYRDVYNKEFSDHVYEIIKSQNSSASK